MAVEPVNELHTYIYNIMGIINANNNSYDNIDKKIFMNSITSFITNVERGEEVYYGSNISNDEYKKMSSPENVKTLRKDVFKLINTVKKLNNDNIYNEMLDLYIKNDRSALLEIVTPKAPSEAV